MNQYLRRKRAVVGRRRLRNAPLIIPLSLKSAGSVPGLVEFLRFRWPHFTRHQLRELYALFAFKSDERDFALRLMASKGNFWVFRCNQKGFCGDFILVDMASPEIGSRSIFVIELKEGVGLKRGRIRGGQLRRVSTALSCLALQMGVIPNSPKFEVMIGCTAEVLACLGVAGASTEQTGDDSV